MNIILIGFMGSGKTTIGEALAKKLNFEFIDTDILIETQNNMSIKDIFNSFGENHFRQLEKQAIEGLRDIYESVIAVGGGAVMYHNNLDTLKSIGMTIFLDAPMHKILRNLEGKFRPLVGNTIDEDKLRQLLNYRYATYKKSDLIINTEGLNIDQTVDEVINRLGLKN